MCAKKEDLITRVYKKEKDNRMRYGYKQETALGGYKLYIRVAVS
jgi:hypothetical protein